MSSEFVHPVFLNSPQKLSALLYSHVEVQTALGETVSGGLLAADPVSDTAVILPANLSTNVIDSNDFASSTIVLVPHVKWDSVVVVDGSDAVREIVKKCLPREAESRVNLTDEEAGIVRGEVRDWLVRNGLKVSVEGSQIYVEDGTVVISPPYGPESSRANNAIVLDRVNNLLTKMSSAKFKK